MIKVMKINNESFKRIAEIIHIIYDDETSERKFQSSSSGMGPLTGISLVAKTLSIHFISL